MSYYGYVTQLFDLLCNRWIFEYCQLQNCSLHFASFWKISRVNFHSRAPRAPSEAQCIAKKIWLWRLPTPARTYTTLRRFQVSHKILQKLTLSCQLYKPSVWRWIDSYQNQAFADKYHMGISGLRWKTGRFEVKFCISSTSIVSAVNRMAARTFRER